MERSTLRALLVLSLVLILTGDYYWVIAHLVRALSGIDISSDSPTFRKPKHERVDTKTLMRGGGAVEHTSSHGLKGEYKSKRGKSNYRNDDEEEDIDQMHANLRAKLLDTMRNSCLPKLICELNATPNKDQLSDSERALLSLIRDTSISTRAETPSKYHFAAHMGLLISGVEGTGCYNFFPSCPFPGLQVLNMMKKIKINGV